MALRSHCPVEAAPVGAGASSGTWLARKVASIRLSSVPPLRAVVNHCEACDASVSERCSRA
jgi:hypothetical protein